MSNVCAFCQGDLAQKTITYPTERDGRVIIIDNFPALVCQQCGETVLQPDVVEKLQQIAWGEVPSDRSIKVDTYDFARVA